MLSNEIEDLKRNASIRNDSTILTELSTFIPGFIRVEVLSNPENYTSMDQTTDIPINKTMQSIGINPKICSNTSNIVLWETSIKGIRLKHMNEWVGLLPCNNRIPLKSYYPYTTKPHLKDPQLFAQQAGWMLSKKQLLNANEHCIKYGVGGLLPPFNPPKWKYEGLYYRKHGVEFWSGGFQLFTNCGMQRFISLDPSILSNQLVYHSSNNKQIQIIDDKSRFIRVNDFLGQLHTLKEWAEEMQ